MSKPSLSITPDASGPATAAALAQPSPSSPAIATAAARGAREQEQRQEHESNTALASCRPAASNTSTQSLPFSLTSVEPEPSRPNRSEMTMRYSFFRRLGRNLARGWRRSPSTAIVFALTLTLLIVQFVATATVLALSWSKPCDQPLRNFLFVLCCLAFFAIPVTLMEAIWMIPEGQNFYLTSRGQWISRMNNTFECVGFVTYLFGNLWLYSSQTCSSTAPSLYYLSLVWIIYGYLLISMPIILCSMVICCLPVAMVFLRSRNGLPNSGSFSLRRGLTTAQIDALPTRSYNARLGFGLERSDSTLNSLRPSDDACAICLGDFVLDEVLRILPCKHEFHQECIDSWLKVNGTCPLCVRKVIDDPAAVQV